MLRDIFGDIKEFHVKYGLGVGSKPAVPSEECVAHRKRMISEETRELLEAIDTGDLVKIAREAIDVLMVVLGTILVYGIPFQNVWRAVHEANMAKSRAPGNTKAAKPSKPPGWVSPDKAIKLYIFGRQAPTSRTVEEVAATAPPVVTKDEVPVDPTAGSSSADVAPILPTVVPPAPTDPVAAAADIAQKAADALASK